jgi:DNA polymerase III subunit beta
MKATIERATLLKSLSHVQSVVERRNTIPILSNVLIEANESGAIKLTATDLDLQIVETLAGDVEVAGSTTVSAHTLFEIARKMPPIAAWRSTQAAPVFRWAPCRATIFR